MYSHTQIRWFVLLLFWNYVCIFELLSIQFILPLRFFLSSVSSSVTFSRIWYTVCHLWVFVPGNLDWNQDSYGDASSIHFYFCSVLSLTVIFSFYWKLQIPITIFYVSFSSSLVFDALSNANRLADSITLSVGFTKFDWYNLNEFSIICRVEFYLKLSISEQFSTCRSVKNVRIMYLLWWKVLPSEFHS